VSFNYRKQAEALIESCTPKQFARKTRYEARKRPMLTDHRGWKSPGNGGADWSALSGLILYLTDSRATFATSSRKSTLGMGADFADNRPIVGTELGQRLGLKKPSVVGEAFASRGGNPRSLRISTAASVSTGLLLFCYSFLSLC
jgi:hypothetical protein